MQDAHHPLSQTASAAALFPGETNPVRAMGSHQSPNARTHTWLTPPHILAALGGFDLDPCACPEPRPWPTAAVHWTRADNSLNRAWSGRVWLNPPYGPRDQIAPWLRRLAEHDCGTALIFARTETDAFFEWVWGRATALLFLHGRLHFHRPDGVRARANAGAPSVLAAYGQRDSSALQRSGLPGQFVALR